MAILFTNPIDGLEHISNVLPLNDDFTVMFWVSPVTNNPSGGAYRNYYALYDSGFNNYIEISSATDGKNIDLYGFDGSNFSTEFGVGPNQFGLLNNFYHVCLTYDISATTIRYYVNGDLIGTIATVDFTGITSTNEKLGYDGFSGLTNLVTQNARAWTGQVLDINQINAEIASNIAIFTTGLLYDTPLTNATDLASLSGSAGANGNWTNIAGAGTNFTTNDVKFLDPIATEGNSVSTAAFVIPYLPYRLVQNIKPTGTTFSTAWFSYTTLVDDNVVGFWTYSDRIAYNPATRVYTGPAASPLLYPIPFTSLGSKLAQFPADDLTEYFLRVDRLGGGGSTSDTGTLILQIDAIGNIAYSVGDIFVPGDNDYVTTDHPTPVLFPGPTIQQSLQETYNNVTTFIKGLYIGEQGDVIETGFSAINSNGNNTPATLNNIGIYNPTFGNINDISTLPSVDTRWVRTGGDQTIFYIASGPEGTPGTITVNTINALGTVGATSWTIPSSCIGEFLTLGGICANTDNTILYYTNFAGGDYTVERWDLVNDAALAQFLPGVAGYWVIGILVLADGSIVVGYQEEVADQDFYVVRYDSDGNLLDTYPFGDTFFDEPHRLAYSSDPSNFRVWVHGRVQHPVICHFYEIAASGGAILEDIPCVEFANTFSYGFATSMPPGRFGPSFSCPFWEIRTGGAPPINPLSGIYKIIPWSRKLADTLYTSLDPVETEDVMIPRPFGKGPPLGQ